MVLLQTKKQVTQCSQPKPNLNQIQNHNVPKHLARTDPQSNNLTKQSFESYKTEQNHKQHYRNVGPDLDPSLKFDTLIVFVGEVFEKVVSDKISRQQKFMLIYSACNDLS